MNVSELRAIIREIPENEDPLVLFTFNGEYQEVEKAKIHIETNVLIVELRRIKDG